MTGNYLTLMFFCLLALTICDQISTNSKATTTTQKCCSACFESSIKKTPTLGQSFVNWTVSAVSSQNFSLLIGQLGRMPIEYTNQLKKILSNYNQLSSQGYYSCQQGYTDLNEPAYSDADSTTVNTFLQGVVNITLSNSGYSAKYLAAYYDMLSRFNNTLNSQPFSADAATIGVAFAAMNVQSNLATQSQYMNYIQSVDNACDFLLPYSCPIRSPFAKSVMSNSYNPFAELNTSSVTIPPGPKLNSSTIYWRILNNKFRQALGSNFQRAYFNYMLNLNITGPGSLAPLPPQITLTAAQLSNGGYALNETDTTIWARLTAIITGPFLYCNLNGFYAAFLNTCPATCNTTC